MDIGIYSPLGDILDSIDIVSEDPSSSDGIWSFTTGMPKVEEGDKFWVAWDRRWQGYFIVDYVVGLELHFSRWTEKDGGERGPFQGFTYKVPLISTREDVRRMKEQDKLFCPKCRHLLDSRTGTCRNPHCKEKGHG